MKSIRFKLWAGMVVLVCFVLFLLWLFQIVFLETYYNRMWISYIKSEVVKINYVLEKGNKEDFEKKLAAFAFNNNIYIEVIDKNGESLYVTGSSVSAGKMPMVDSGELEGIVDEVLKGEEVEIPVTHPQFGSEFSFIGLPIEMSGKTKYAMLIITPLAPMEDTASILKGQLLYITVILLFAALLITLFLSRSFSNPILEMKRVSEQMASGNFSARINTRRRDEIGQLAETINNMGEQLSEIDQLRKDVIANVSHDLRTPLSLIRGYAETLRDVTGKDPQKREKQLGIIIEETERLSKIVDDILNLSQLQSGNVLLTKSSFKINELIQTTVKSYSLLSEKNGVSIILKDIFDVMIEADEVRVSQVLHNLINNACTHTPRGGLITVKMQDNGESVRIEIADTGNGISTKELPHIWERYYKADKTSEKKTTGTGIGLAIVKEILEAHKVRFGVESEKLIGTTFWFELNKYK